jgi:hypothetical protein
MIIANIEVHTDTIYYKNNVIQPIMIDDVENGFMIIWSLIEYDLKFESLEWAMKYIDTNLVSKGDD